MNDTGHDGRPYAVHMAPGVVSVENGTVLLDGPNGLAATMTPAAAAETGRRLIAAAEAALDQPG